MPPENGLAPTFRFRVGWGDIDGNGHMANTAYLDHAADTRVQYLSSQGFTTARFVAERIGPVILREEIVYRRELRLNEEYTVDMRSAGLSPDSVRFRIENTFRDLSGELIATVTSEGVWFDLDARRPRVPPKDLETVMRDTPRSPAFTDLPLRGR